MVERNEVGELSNELTYIRYLMDKGKTREIFHKITMPEYIALHIIENECENSAIYSGRTYLKDLSEKMKLTIRQTSKLIEELKDSGVVQWSHDGNGSEGTYVSISENGKRFLHEQEKILSEVYGTVIEQFGKENLIELLQKLKQLETVLSSAIEDREAVGTHDRMDRIDG